MRNNREFWAAARFSWQGFVLVWQGEVAFRQYATFAVFLIPLALYLGNSGLEKAVLIFSLLTVLLAEIINTAIEAAVDRIGEENHPLSGAAKDLGSAAVFLSVVMFAVVWLLVLWG